ncbi:uncharacterized protein LOC113315348 [Papaver somniferum]|uniref:uncharacterized protein LOC113315348 n=1 Tax=Papaver somniferum TaxID=3469 RepID=UPI000E700D70|nr:uncharacterized protein LOC113315348 [Papaver somniferum]
MQDLMKDHHRHCLAVNILSGKFSYNTLQIELKNHWTPMQIKHLETITHTEAYKLVMHHETDKNKILEHKPWIISEQVVLFEDYEKFIANPDQSFLVAVFWLQILHLPRYWIDKLSIEQLLQNVGTVLEVDLSSSPPRAKIEMDLQNPFTPGILLNCEKATWIQLAYEYLPMICYRCGFLGHIARECSKFVSTDHVLMDTQFPKFPYHRLNSRMKDQNPQPKTQNMLTSSSSNIPSKTSASTHQS